MSDRKKRVCAAALTLLGAAFLAAILLFDWDSINQYSMYDTSTRSYVRATVTEIRSERLEQDDADRQLMLGEQEITVELTEGAQRGETVEIDNYLTQIHNIRVSVGQRILVCADQPAEAAPYYTVYQYDRSVPLLLLLGVFVLAVLVVGRGKGVRALLGLAFCLVTVMGFLLQAVFHGFNPVGVAFVTVLICTGASLLLLNGLTKRSLSAGVATLAGTAAVGIAYAIFSTLLHLSGYNTEEAETLLLVGDATGLSIRYLLFAGVLISALGAVMDVAVSLTAALDELVLVQPDLGRGELLRAGMHIGRDMIGTMSNTLILAFAGTALNTMLCLMACGYQNQQLFSSDFLTIELAQGICATLGVVLTVPITTVVAAGILLRGRQSSPQGDVMIEIPKIKNA